jgi:hypothetical protein
MNPSREPLEVVDISPSKAADAEVKDSEPRVRKASPGRERLDEDPASSTAVIGDRKIAKAIEEDKKDLYNLHGTNFKLLCFEMFDSELIWASWIILAVTSLAVPFSGWLDAALSTQGLNLRVVQVFWTIAIFFVALSFFAIRTSNFEVHPYHRRWAKVALVMAAVYTASDETVHPRSARPFVASLIGTISIFAMYFAMRTRKQCHRKLNGPYDATLDRDTQGAPYLSGMAIMVLWLFRDIFTWAGINKSDELYLAIFITSWVLIGIIYFIMEFEEKMCPFLFVEDEQGHKQHLDLLRSMVAQHPVLSECTEDDLKFLAHMNVVDMGEAENKTAVMGDMKGNEVEVEVDNGVHVDNENHTAKVCKTNCCSSSLRPKTQAQMLKYVLRTWVVLMVLSYLVYADCITYHKKEDSFDLSTRCGQQWLGMFIICAVLCCGDLDPKLGDKWIAIFGQFVTIVAVVEFCYILPNWWLTDEQMAGSTKMASVIGLWIALFCLILLVKIGQSAYNIREKKEAKQVWLKHIRELANEGHKIRSFSELDVNHDGKLDAEEWKHKKETSERRENVGRSMESGDENDDGAIDEQEFLSMQDQVREVTNCEIWGDMLVHILARAYLWVMLFLVIIGLLISLGAFVVNTYRFNHMCGRNSVYPDKPNSKYDELMNGYNTFNSGEKGGTPFAFANTDTTKVNKALFAGLHNSYHQMEPWGTILTAWGYSHPNFTVQLDRGIREIELDIHYDGETGEFHVYHLQLLDQLSSCVCLTQCLQQIKEWSDNNPQHSVIWVWIEPRGLKSGDLWCHYEDIGYSVTEKVMDKILEYFPTDKIVMPATVRGNYPTMQAALKAGNENLTAGNAVLGYGWPMLGEAKGKFIFTWNLWGAQTTSSSSNMLCSKYYSEVAANHPEKAIMFERGWKWSEPASKQRPPLMLQQ